MICDEIPLANLVDKGTLPLLQMREGKSVADSVFPLADQITELGAVRTPYLTGKAKLFNAAIAFTSYLAAADLAAIEANFVGYAAVTFTSAGPVYVDPAGGVSFDLAAAVFVATDGTMPNDIYGGWVEDSTGLLLFAWQMVTPYSMGAALDTMNVNLIINRFGPRDVVVVINGNPV